MDEVRPLKCRLWLRDHDGPQVGTLHVIAENGQPTLFWQKDHRGVLYLLERADVIQVEPVKTRRR